MKKYLIIIHLLLIAFSNYSQKSTTDSLIAIFKKETKNHEKLNTLIELTKELAPVSLEKCQEYSKIGINLARKVKDKKSEAIILNNYADAYSYKNNFTEADKLYREALSLFLKINDYESITSTYTNIALNYYYQYKFDSAIIFYNKTLELSKTKKLTKNQADAFYGLGLIKRRQGIYNNAIDTIKEAYNLYRKIKDDNGQAKSLTALGNIASEITQYDSAARYYNMALEIRKKNNDKRGSAILLYNIGNIYFKSGKYNDALNNFIEAQKIFEEIDLEEGIANCFNNIGLINQNLSRGDNFEQNKFYYNRALKNFELALEIYKKIENKTEISNSLNNIANVYSFRIIDSLTNIYGEKWNDSLPVTKIARLLKKPIDLYKQSLEINQKLGNKRGISTAYTNLANHYRRMKNYNQALEYLQKAILIDYETENNFQLSNDYYEVAKIYQEQGDYIKSIETAKKALQISLQSNNANMTKDCYKLLSELYELYSNHKLCFQYYKRYTQLQDSLVNEDNLRQINELNIKFETEKKQHQIDLLNKDKLLTESKNRQLRIMTIAAFSVIFMIVVIVILLIKQNRERKKVNIDLANKNALISEQKKHITDSINYASLIQNAVMPSPSTVQKYFNDMFVFFRPRDIVSGDFYWFAEKNNKIIVAAADCTGHGVPGAFMSMLGISTLNDIITSTEIINSDEILNELRRRIIKSLNQPGHTGESKDGMDIALYVYDPDTLIIEYSGANNPLILIRNDEIIEYKADKMPIGVYIKSETPFKKNIIEIKKGDWAYVYSDGYADQFGGTDKRKFMTKNLKELLAKISKEQGIEQEKILEKTNIEWRGDIPQVDDMLIIGVKF
jgi:serine phosphatase RsbU (regulator of sigma subunit)/Tfp pilus assembly protein PilF